MSVDLLVSASTLDLIGEGIDVAIRHGELVEPNLPTPRMGLTPVVFVEAPSFLASWSEPSTVSDLEKYPRIVLIAQNVPLRWVFSGKNALSSFVPDCRPSLTALEVTRRRQTDCDASCVVFSLRRKVLSD